MGGGLNEKAKITFFLDTLDLGGCFPAWPEPALLSSSLPIRTELGLERRPVSVFSSAARNAGRLAEGFPGSRVMRSGARGWQSSGRRRHPLRGRRFLKAAAAVALAGAVSVAVCGRWPWPQLCCIMLFIHVP